jgi:hypothetical protein
MLRFLEALNLPSGLLLFFSLGDCFAVFTAWFFLPDDLSSEK